MIYLALSILCSSAIMVLFKLFRKYNVDVIKAIVVNYMAAAISGYLLMGRPPQDADVHKWLIPAMVLGLTFFLMFGMIAYGIKKAGLTVGTLATKMSVVIPIAVAFLVFNDTINALKILGIILVLGGVIMAGLQTGSVKHFSLWLPLILFFGNGAIDTSIKLCEAWFVPEAETALFSASLFGFAFLSGLIWIIIKKRWPIRRRDALWGIALGIPNFGSIYFLMKALSQANMESSVIFPVNNMSIVIISTLTGFVVFREKLSAVNWSGVLLSLAAIILIILSL